MGYPWTRGDELFAADLNAAIAMYAPPPGSGGYLPVSSAALFLPLAGNATVTGPTTFSDMLSVTGSTTWASGAFPGTNPAIYQQVTYTGGTPTSGLAGPEGTSYPITLFENDESISGPLSGAGGVAGVEIQHNTWGGSGARYALLCVHQVRAPVAAGNNHYYAANFFETSVGNAAGAAPGAGNGIGQYGVFGLYTNVGARNGSNPVNAHEMQCLEWDFTPGLNSTADFVSGLKLVNWAQTGFHAYNQEAFIIMATADYRIMSTFNTGILFGDVQSYGNGFPISTTGTMISSLNGTAGVGIDFSAVTFNTAFIKGPGGFQVDNNNTVHTNTITPTAGLLTLSNLATPFNIVDNTHTTGLFDILHLQEPGLAAGGWTIARIGKDFSTNFYSGYIGYALNATANQSGLHIGIFGYANDHLILLGDGSLISNANKLGFFTSGPAVAKQTVTGACAGNTAIKALLTALANYGLLTDSTTA